jgi:hypothetical protein
LKTAAARPDDCQLAIYSSEQEISRPWEAICMIDSRTGTTLFHDRDAAAAIQQAKSAACQCGADAILIESMDTQGVTWGTWGQGKAILRGIRYR